LVRPSVVAVVAIVSAFLGGTGALLVGKAAGWTDAETDTVVVSPTGAETPARAEVEPTDDAARPLPGNGFDARAIYRERVGGVVTIYSLFDEHEDDGEGAAAQGTGFVVSEDGYILTNSHVITTAGEGAPNAPAEAASSVFIEFSDGDRAEAKIVGWDVFDDVGLLKVEPGAHALRPLPLGDSSKVEVGEPVAAIGSPFGQASSLAVGVVGATERSINSLTSQYSLVDAIQTDAPINRGNSGGPLLDARGRVIGINAQIRSDTGTAEGVGFAVPINSAVRSMEQLIATGRVRYAWVGITTQSVTPSLARRFDLPAREGAAVQCVYEDSPAARAELRDGRAAQEFAGLPFRPGGDLIVGIGDQPDESAEDVVRAVLARLPGERIEFTLLRGEERLTVPVVLGERPRRQPDDPDDRDC
ncbi:MAG: trypsin-like peptidase domain-containing protein, partial [Actinomycetota bacterium]|nr:trypsin-like peptidase domain-containing protein [Actinomycetota bacterium]